jgi:hypothetical protein
MIFPVYVTFVTFVVKWQYRKFSARLWARSNIMAGSRNGLQQFLKLCHRICKLLGVWQASIVGAINASSLSSDQKAEIVSVINAVNTACDAMVLIMQKYEL